MHRRRVAALALLLAAGVTLVGIGRGPAGAAAPPTPPVVVVVGEGDTVWDLVSAHLPDGVDRSAYVAEVVAANDLDPLRLVPGTPVRLP